VLFFRQALKVIFDLLDRMARGSIRTLLEHAGALILDHQAIKDSIGFASGQGIFCMGQRSDADLCAKLLQQRVNFTTEICFGRPRREYLFQLCENLLAPLDDHPIS